MALKHKNMKKLIYILTIAALSLTGCNKAPSLRELICREWRGVELSADAGIYINFMSDGTFELYQKLENKFELRRGTWTLKGDILSGKYNDDEAWAADYKVSANKNQLTMISLNEGNETSIYVRCSIPSIIKEGSTVVVKSAAAVCKSAL